MRRHCGSVAQLQWLHQCCCVMNVLLCLRTCAWLWVRARAKGPADKAGLHEQHQQHLKQRQQRSYSLANPLSFHSCPYVSSPLFLVRPRCGDPPWELVLGVSSPLVLWNPFCGHKGLESHGVSRSHVGNLLPNGHRAGESGHMRPSDEVPFSDILMVSGSHDGWIPDGCVWLRP